MNFSSSSHLDVDDVIGVAAVEDGIGNVPVDVVLFPAQSHSLFSAQSPSLALPRREEEEEEEG